MSRCPHLRFHNNGSFFSDDKYECKLCQKEFNTDDPRIRVTCDNEYEDAYKDCHIYRNRRYF